MEGPPDVSLTSGMPEEERKERTVRIYKPAKNAMQSGTAGIKRLVVVFYLLSCSVYTCSGGRLNLTTSRGGRTT